MSQKDTITKKYMQNPDIFADFFNGYIYNGDCVIKSEDLSEVDTSNIAIIPYIKGKKPITIKKYRDIIKRAVLMQSDKAYYLFLGIENQSDIHYAMPVRNMLYNALVYNQQVEAKAKYNRENGICEDDEEFLSGFTKNDKLIPVITVTVYWGVKPWDGPVTLKEMFTDIDESADKIIDDYNCNLFSIIDIDELPIYKTELNELFRLLRVRNDGNALYNLITGNKKYENISKDTAIMMREFTDIRLPRKNKGGNYNMCKAVEDIQRMGIKQGIKQGIEQGKLSQLIILVNKGLLTVVDAAKEAKKTEEEFRKLL